MVFIVWFKIPHAPMLYLKNEFATTKYLQAPGPPSFAKQT